VRKGEEGKGKRGKGKEGKGKEGEGEGKGRDVPPNVGSRSTPLLVTIQYFTRIEKPLRCSP